MASKVSFLNSDLIWKLFCLKISIHSHHSQHQVIFLILEGKALLIRILSFPRQSPIIISAPATLTWCGQCLLRTVHSLIFWPFLPPSSSTLYLVKTSNSSLIQPFFMKLSLTASKSEFGILRYLKVCLVPVNCVVIVSVPGGQSLDLPCLLYPPRPA